MHHSDAHSLSLKHHSKADTIHVTSDGSVYINGNIDQIKKHSKENKLDLFQVKPELIETKKSK